MTLPVPDHGAAQTLPIPAGAVSDGHPATWPCGPIRYAVNATEAPPGALEDLTAVLTDLTAATGQTFTPAGTTTRFPEPGDIENGPAVGAAPLTIAWAHHPGTSSTGAGESALLTGDEVAGKATTVTAYRPRRGLIPPKHTIEAADVVIDASLVADPAGGSWGGVSGQRAFLQHELLHALGLDHTATAGSVLGKALPTGRYEQLGAGDAAALRALTAQRRC